MRISHLLVFLFSFIVKIQFFIVYPLPSSSQRTPADVRLSACESVGSVCL